MIEISYSTGTSVAGGQLQAAGRTQTFVPIQIDIGLTSLAVYKDNIRETISVDICYNHPVGLSGGKLGTVSRIEAAASSPIHKRIHVKRTGFFAVRKNDILPGIIVQISHGNRRCSKRGQV